MPVFRKTTKPAEVLPKTLAQNYLISHEIFAQEQDRIFSKQWLCVGHRNDLPYAGDYFLAEFAGESALVLREPRGRIRAFYNVCRHRGTTLCEQKKGQFRQTIQCPYHA